MRPWGIVSYFALCLPVLFGIGRFRRRAYETFYWLQCVVTPDHPRSSCSQVGVAAFLGFGVAHVPLPFLPCVRSSRTR